MARARCSIAAIAFSLLAHSLAAQVFNPSQITLLPPQQGALGVYFASSQPSPSQTLTGADVFLRDGGGVLHRLTTVANQSDSIRDFAISDDGSLLAYVTMQHAGISILRTGDGHVDSVSFHSACSSGCPLAHFHFTHDAKYLLFNVTSAPSNESPSWAWPLYAVRLADGYAVMLASGELGASGQHVISDAGKVIFTSANPASTLAEPQPPVNVYTVYVDKTVLKQLTNFGAASPNVAQAASIDSNGSMITFEAGTAFSSQGLSAVYRAKSDGTEVESLGAPAQSCISPTLSEDGEQIAFVCDGGKLYFAKARGPANVEALTPFPYSLLDHPVIDELANEVFFTSGPTDPFRFGEIGAIFGIHLGSRQLDKVQFPRHLSAVEDADNGSVLYPIPGGVIDIEATNLRSNSLIQANYWPLPDLLAGATLYVNGKKAPILSISPWDIFAQVPWGTPVGKTSFQVKLQDGNETDETQVLEEQTAADSPLVEGFAAANNFGCQAAAYHSGTNQLADQAHPANIGETVDIITSGLGVTTPIPPDGVLTPAAPAYRLAGPLTVYLGSGSLFLPSVLKFAGLQPGTFGKYRVSVVVPAVNSSEVQIGLEIHGTLNDGQCIFFANVP
jgi:uncharacterized protein (TIGR03437 family)